MCVKSWLFSATILCCVIFAAAIPTERLSGMCNPTDDAVEQEIPATLPHELCFGHDDNNDNQIYKLDTQSLEDYSNETEFGQELIDLLLQRGEIKLKSTNDDDDAKVHQGENVKNERYDELINAFNVILEEILRQGKLTKHESHQNHESNYNHIDDNSEDLQRKSRAKPKCSTERCLNSIESELLQKIKVLNSQLNTLIKSSGSQQPKRGGGDSSSVALSSVNHSGKRPAVNVDKNDADNVPTTTDRSHHKRATQSIGEETGESKYDLMTTDKHSGGATVGKRHAQADEKPEYELSKDNNYGVERSEFVKYGPNEQHNSYSNDNDDQPKTEPNTESSTTPSVPALVNGGIKIPMRIVKGSNGGFNLILDRTSLCRRCKARTNNN